MSRTRTSEVTFWKLIIQSKHFLNIRIIGWSFLFISFVAILIVSCGRSNDLLEEVLESSGENRKELDKVLGYYSEPKDSLKFKAAVFLISNIRTKYALDQSKIGKHNQLLLFVDSIYNNHIPIIRNGKKYWEQFSNIRNRKTIVDSFWTATKNKYGPLNLSTLPVVRDLTAVKSEFLIENIDYAFLSWKKPWNKHLTFDEFCQYLLPYRNLNEPLENWRKEAYFKYKDKIPDTTTTALSAALSIFDEVSIISENYLTFREYPDLGWKNLNNVLIGTCRDESTFLNNTMKSQGIPVFTIVQPFGTVYNCLLNSDGTYLQFNGGNKPDKDFNYYLDIRKNPSGTMPKIYREAFEEDTRLLDNLPHKNIPPFFRNPNLKDMTALLHDNAVEVSFENDLHFDENEHVFLCYFYNYGGINYTAIDWDKFKNENINFSAVGVEKIYFLATYDNNEYMSFTNPFYINARGKLEDLKYDYQSRESTKIYRKYPRNLVETEFARKLLGSYFEGSNNRNFTNSERLYTITELPDVPRPVSVNPKTAYKYIRHVVDTTINLAKLEFLDKNEKTLQGTLIHSSVNKSYHPENVFDGDIRTNYNNMDSCSWIGLEFDEPKLISDIKILYRNSFNTIEPNREYSIFYWENGKWIFLNKQKAIDDFIEVEIPQNALLLLKSSNKAEQNMVFFIRDGVQIWG